jgi:putative transposase
MLFCDNGSEFSSPVMDLWAYHNPVKIDFSRPGKPTDNAHVESFNGTLRAECLDAHWFSHLPEAGERVETWRWNTIRVVLRGHCGSARHTNL